VIDIGLLLIDPKYDHNVAAGIRAAHVFGADVLHWTGTRVPRDARLPREERMKLYRTVSWGTDTTGKEIDAREFDGLTPVAVEVRDNAESLHEFVHPEKALYVFGPEDGSIPKGTLARCHRFVRIPTSNRTPLNLGAAINVVLYDRLAKML
jgi:tRNA(Leu) C34 or U34 (ribose-2'-O)-methylase TrmL